MESSISVQLSSNFVNKLTNNLTKDKRRCNQKKSINFSLSRNIDEEKLFTDEIDAVFLRPRDSRAPGSGEKKW